MLLGRAPGRKGGWICAAGNCLDEKVAGTPKHALAGDTASPGGRCFSYEPESWHCAVISVVFR